MKRSFIVGMFIAILALSGALYYYRAHVINFFSFESAAPIGGTVIEIKSAGEFDKTINNKKLSVVKYYAPWCGYCMRMAPVYDKLASEHKGAVLAKVDFTKEHGKQLAQKAGVGGFPTFALYKGGKKIDEVIGANEPDLRAKIAKHSA